MTLITYSKTLDNYTPQLNDECEIWTDHTFYFLRIRGISANGRILTEVTSKNGVPMALPHQLMTFENKERLFDAIGDV